MENYLTLNCNVLAHGDLRPNRTDDPTLSVFGRILDFDLREAFPVVAAKYVPLDKVVAELVGFIRGVTSAADFRDLGTKIWDENANKNEDWLRNPHRRGHDDLGPIYGEQWRRWESTKTLRTGDLNFAQRRDAYIADGYEVLGTLTYDGGGLLVLRKYIDQLQELIDGIKRDPNGRRHKVTAWNPAIMKEVALPPCHDGFQCYVDGGYLDMQMTQRSADLYLGVPFNISSYAALLHVIAHLTGKTARHLRMVLGDTHIYTSHLKAEEIMLARPALHNATKLHLDPFSSLDTLTTAHFHFDNYVSHPALPVKMAV